MHNYNILQFLRTKKLTEFQFNSIQILYFCLSMFGLFSAANSITAWLAGVMLFFICVVSIECNKEIMVYKPKSESSNIWKIGKVTFVGTENQAIVYSVLECNDEQPELIGEVIHFT